MIITRYVSRRLAANVVIVLIVITTLSLTFELMEEGDNITKHAGSVVPAISRYVALRLPEVIAELLPFAALLGAIIVVGLLLRHSEVVAIWNSGVSAFGLMRAALPVGLALVAIQISLDDQLVPPTRAMLEAWGVGKAAEREGMLARASKSVWLLTDEGDVVHIPKSAATANHFGGLEIFRRDENGQLTAYSYAEDARRDGSGWLLSNVTRRTVNPPSIEKIPYMDWEPPAAVEHIPLISKLLKDLRLEQLWRLVVHKGYGQRSAGVYRTWFHYRIAAALSPLLLILLVISLAQRFQRTGTFVRLMISSIAIGFGYMVFEGMSLSLGEAGLLAPFIAGWGPAILLVSAIGYFTLARSG
ncbi:MAG: LptF/LptG family permease [Rhodospirillales bacterium]